MPVFTASAPTPNDATGLRSGSETAPYRRSSRVHEVVRVGAGLGAVLRGALKEAREP